MEASVGDMLEALSTALTELEGQAGDLHAAVFKTLKERRRSAPDGIADDELKILAGELRSLAGTLNSLKILAFCLRGPCKCPLSPQPDLGHLATCRAALDVIGKLLRPDPAASAVRSAASCIEGLGQARRKLEIGVATHTGPGLLRALSSARSNLRITQHDVIESPPVQPPNPRLVSAETVRSWIELLNRPEYNREPEESMIERDYVAMRHAQTPEYSVAAAYWPEYAEQFWEELEPDIVALFDPAKRFNRIQWCAEYARQRWPDKFGTSAISLTPMMKLTNQLCDESISPLHIAAALNLPSLCSRLIRDGDDAIAKKCSLGPPLMLALLGPESFVCSSDTWQVLDREIRDKKARIDTVNVLLNAWDSRVIFLTFADTGIMLCMASIAFPICLKLESSSLFSRLVPSSVHIADARFISTLVPRNKDEVTRTFEEMITSLIDMALPSADEILPDRDLLRAASALVESMDLELRVTEFNNKIASKPDDEYWEMVRWSIVTSQLPALKRLIMDARWDANAPYSNPRRRPSVSSEATDEGSIAVSDDGGTLLHLAAEREGMSVQVLSLILDFEPDIEARDNVGRTPLMLAESEDVLRTLVNRGCDTAAIDMEGRNIWHYAAANNDVCILKCLSEVDPNRDRNLRVVNKNGHTPLAESVLFIKNTRAFYGPGSPKATHVLLDICKDERDMSLFQSKEPLLHIAAEWGGEEILLGLLKAGLDPKTVDDNGYTVLHKLRYYVTEAVIDHLREAWPDAPLQTKDGLTPAETILINLQPRLQRALPPQRPSLTIKKPLIHPHAYKKLLTPETLESRDSQGRGLWERFCRLVLTPALAVNHEAFEVAVAIAIPALINAGVLRRYEEEKQDSGLSILLGEGNITCSEARQQKVDLLTLIVQETRYMDKLVEDARATKLLRFAICANSRNLLNALLASGVSVFDVYKERSTLDHILCGTSWPEPMVKVIFQSKATDKTRLNEHNAQGRAPIHMLLDGRFKTRYREEKLKFLLDQGADPNVRVRGFGEPTALVSFIMENYPECALILLEAGADPSLGTKDGLDGIIAAAARGSVRLLEKMRTKLGADFDWNRQCSTLFRVGASGLTYSAANANPLHFACFNNHDAALRFCIEVLKLDPSSRISDDQRTPMHYAVLGGTDVCIRILAEKGADINARTNFGVTPLHDAVLARNIDGVRTLLKLGARHVTNSAGIMPFHLAFRANNEFVDVFMSYLYRDESGEPQAPAAASVVLTGRRWLQRAKILGVSLQRTIQNSSYKECALFVSCIPPKERNNLVMDCGGCTPLMMAVATMSRKNPAIIQLLLRNGFRGFTGTCRKHFVGIGSFNVLVEACKFGLGADPPVIPPRDAPDAKDCFNLLLDTYLENEIQWLDMPFTALHTAVFRSNLYALKVIIAHIKANARKYRKIMGVAGLEPSLEADVPSTDALGEELVCRAVNHQVEYGICENDDTVLDSSPLHIAAKRCPMVAEIISLLLDNGAKVDVQDREINTPLHVAAESGFTRAVELLLERGADPDLENFEFNTPLMTAVAAGNLGIAKLLVEHGARIDVKAPTGANLLGICADSCKNPAVYHYLRGLGLDMHNADRFDYTSLHEMVVNRHFTEYVTNTDVDLCALGPIGRGFVSMVIGCNLIEASSILDRLFRRTGREKAVEMMNAPTGRFVSALCNAVQRGDRRSVKLMIRWGVDVDEEGSEDGSALMMACAQGRFDVVKELVLGGASLTYDYIPGEKARQHVVELKEPPGPVRRSAVEAAGRFPWIVRWILVDRFAEMGLLTYTPNTTAVAGTQAGWAGPRRIAYVLPGEFEQCGVAERESRKKFLKRMTRVRHVLRGHVVSGKLVDEEEQGRQFGDGSRWDLGYDELGKRPLKEWASGDLMAGAHETA